MAGHVEGMLHVVDTCLDHVLGVVKSARLQGGTGASEGEAVVPGEEVG